MQGKGKHCKFIQFLKVNLLQSHFFLRKSNLTYLFFTTTKEKAAGSGSAFRKPVLWIRIRMDSELLPGSGSVIKVPDPDLAKSERAYK